MAVWLVKWRRHSQQSRVREIPSLDVELCAYFRVHARSRSNVLSVWGTERPEDTGRKGRSRSMSWRWAVKGWALITSHGVGCVRVLRRLPKDGLQILLCALICREANL